MSDADFARQLSRSLGLHLTSKDNLLLYAVVEEWIGTPYRYGGITKRGVDCSGFVLQVFRKVYRKQLSASSDEMYRRDCAKVSKKKLREGDLVFFSSTKGSKRITHVGIYLKGGYFAHASTSKGVMVSRLDEPYFSQRWAGGGRAR